VMGNWILRTPPWVACKNSSWVRERSRVEEKYQSNVHSGSYRKLTLMLSSAWDEWNKQKESSKCLKPYL